MKFRAGLAQKHIVRYLNKNRKNTHCKFEIQYFKFKNLIAFKMFLSHACSVSNFMLLIVKHLKKYLRCLDITKASLLRISRIDRIVCILSFHCSDVIFR